VIRGAQRCLVTLPDNTPYEATIKGVWPDKDIAVLRVDAPADRLHPIAVGSSSDLLVGQTVYAIGNPFGLDFTLTTGVVSALNREIESLTGRTIQGVIQTDAAINPGNSGGPLLDSAGRLIGMNTMILSRSGGSAGIGFSVPVDTINQVVPQLITHGRVIRPGLGVVLADDQLAQRLELKGVLIVSVQKDSAADRAGLRPTMEGRNGRIILGDIILRVGTTPTPNQNALLNALERYEVGEAVELTVQRENAVEQVKVTLQAIQ
jgi:S1-C subfamily serine protease